MVRAEEKLFRAIRSKHEKVRPWKKETMEILGLGKSAFYNRVNGQTPLLLEEAIRLSRHFDVPFREIEEPNHHSIFEPLAFHSSVDFLSYWHSFFEKATPDQSLITYAQRLPLMQILVSPPLLQEYCIRFSDERQLPNKSKEIINEIVKMIPYQKGIEVWSSQIFHDYRKRQLNANLHSITDESGRKIQFESTILQLRSCIPDLKNIASKIRVSTKKDDTIPFCFLTCNPQNNLLTAELWPNYWVEIRQPDFIKMVTWKVEHLFEMGYEAQMCLEDLF